MIPDDSDDPLSGGDFSYHDRCEKKNSREYREDDGEDASPVNRGKKKRESRIEEYLDDCRKPRPTHREEYPDDVVACHRNE